MIFKENVQIYRCRLPDIYHFKDGLTTVSSMIFIMRMSIVNARTRKEGLYIHDIDVIEMELVLT